MFKEMEAWSPDQELQLLEELTEAETQAFDEEMEPPVRLGPGDSGWPWVAFWRLPPNGIRSKSRAHSRLAQGR
jgi:hypothetical protein